MSASPMMNTRSLGMDILKTIFSLLCGQSLGRYFTIAGQPLPLCQRCTGMYIAMALTFAYLLATRKYRHRQPAIILCLNILSIAVMLVFGLHLLDPGPGWRFWTGLIFAHAITYMILPATWRLYSGKQPERLSRSDIIPSVAFFALLNTIALWFPLQYTWFGIMVKVLIFLGLLCPLVCLGLVVLHLTGKLSFLLIPKGLKNEYSQT